MNTIVKYVKSLYAYSKLQFLINLLFMFLDGLTSGISLVLLIPLFSLTGITGQTTTGMAVFDDLLSSLHAFDIKIKLIFILGLYLFLILIQALIGRKMAILNTSIIQGYTKHMRDTLFEAIVKTEMLCFHSKKKADITNMFSNEISRIASGTLFFLRITSQIIISLFQIAVAFYMSVSLTLFVILLAAIIFRYMKASFVESKKLGESLRLTNQKLMSHILEQLNGIKEVKCYGIEENQIDSLKKTTENTKNNLINFTKLQTRTTMLYKITAAIVISCLFYVALVIIKIEPASLFILIYIFARLWPSFTSFQNNLQNVISMIPAFESLTGMMNSLKENAESDYRADNLLVDEKTPMDVVFHNVSFQYQNDCEFELNELNFRIPDKKMTAIVGKSGAGKSTIVDLLLGLIKPTAGEININDTVLDAAKIKSWRKCTAFVPQDPFLLNSTIRENLLKFNPNVNENDIIQALKYASAWEFVVKMEKGLDTIIGDNGVRLSGGEKQRIVLARALLRKPRLLVLDEATSALDNENECKIQKAIENLSNMMTVVVIAHRLSTIVNAENIIVLSDGKIVEQGKYSDLVNNKEGYFKLHRK